MQEDSDYEAHWQIAEIEEGRAIRQATVLFNPDSGETCAMRSKEDAHDYRYFPDPDLLPLVINLDWIEKTRLSMPELPAHKRDRFIASYALSTYDAATLTAALDVADYFEAAVAVSGAGSAKICANWVTVDLAARLNKEGRDIAEAPVSPIQLGGLVARIADQTISNNIAKKVFETLWNGEGKSADEIIEQQGLKQITDGSAIETLIDGVLAANAPMVAEFKAGKDKAFNALVGQAMKAAKGQANPQQVNALLRKKLGEV